MEKLIYVWCCLITSFCFSQSHYPADKVTLATETYAFLEGQDRSLATIAIQFPELKNDVAAIRKQTQEIQDNAKGNIRAFLECTVGLAAFETLQHKIDALIGGQFSPVIAQKKHALHFLDEVRKRLQGRGAIPDLIHRTILAFAFAEHPEKELEQKHLVTTTIEHPAMSGVNLAFHVPESWAKTEAAMPETLVEFTSFAGTGHEKILLLAYDVGNVGPDFLAPASVREMIPPHTVLVRNEPYFWGTVQGSFTETEEVYPTKDGDKKVRMLQFMFVRDHYLYCLQGSAGPVSKNENLGPSLAKYEKLFHKVAASLSICPK